MKRVHNLEGAFPLLLVGGALLVYAAIIANQELVAHNSHVPLWGLVSAVGVVIAGAGVYSAFLEEPAPAAPVPVSDSVTIPKTEYEALRAGRSTPPKAPPPATVPEWWEGPPLPPPPRPSPLPSAEPVADLGRPRPVPASLSSPVRRPSTPTPRELPVGRTPTPVPSRAPTPRIPPAGPAPFAARTSLKDLKSALSELESLLDHEFTVSPRATPKPAPTGVPACADCRRALPKSPAANDCSGCGKGLCNDCTLSSQFEDGDIRCIECRARDPWPRRSAR